MIGEKVVKRSGKPFKSGFKVNTVKEVIAVSNTFVCTFEEDDSFVWIGTLGPISTHEKPKDST